MYLNLNQPSNDLSFHRGTNSYKVNGIGNVLKPIVTSMISQTKSLINKTNYIILKTIIIDVSRET